MYCITHIKEKPDQIPWRYTSNICLCSIFRNIELFLIASSPLCISRELTIVARFNIICLTSYEELCIVKFVYGIQSECLHNIPVDHYQKSMYEHNPN